MDLLRGERIESVYTKNRVGGMFREKGWNADTLDERKWRNMDILEVRGWNVDILGERWWNVDILEERGCRN